MKKLLLTLAVLGAVTFSYAADEKAADQAAPAKDEKCCKEGDAACCKDKAGHEKDCTCADCKAAADKAAEKPAPKKAA